MGKKRISKSSVSVRSTGRAKPVVAKAGTTSTRSRRYGCGGKVKK
jgi:hypothetical protein